MSSPIDVDAIVEECRAAGISVSDADIARIVGDDAVQSARITARILRVPMLLGAGWLRRQDAFDGLGMWDHVPRRLRLICSISREDDGEVWAHLSVSRADRQVATWDELRFVKETVFPDRVALQVLPPKSEWYTIQEDGRSVPRAGQPYAEVLHLWVCLTKRPTPDFRGSEGTI